MARKNLLAGLTDEKLPAGNSALTPDASQSKSSHAFPNVRGRDRRSLALDRADQVAGRGRTRHAPDRPIAHRRSLADLAEAMQDLIATIRDNGQQVPILVRPHPETPDDIRLPMDTAGCAPASNSAAACAPLIKSLSDQELVVAQGQENNARTDLAFIERALFAAPRREGGYAATPSWPRSRSIRPACHA